MTDWKVGDKAIVTGDKEEWGHDFPSGTHVTITEISLTPESLRCVDDTGEKWFVHVNDLAPVPNRFAEWSRSSMLQNIKDRGDFSDEQIRTMSRNADRELLIGILLGLDEQEANYDPTDKETGGLAQSWAETYSRDAQMKGEGCDD